MTRFRFLFPVLFALVLCFAGLSTVGCDATYSEGARVGVLEKFSYKGVINKSYEGTVILDGMTRDSEGALQVRPWYFTLRPDQPGFADIKTKMESWQGRRVRITYRQVLINSSVSQDSDYCATGIELVDESGRVPPPHDPSVTITSK